MPPVVSKSESANASQTHEPIAFGAAIAYPSKSGRKLFSRRKREKSYENVNCLRGKNGGKKAKQKVVTCIAFIQSIGIKMAICFLAAENETKHRVSISEMSGRPAFLLVGSFPFLSRAR